ncbi:hypothetical protein [Sphingobium jiangsuense]|uniref:hypothetical protein n=1 Tax=Sphingobium jiangsuense TaxID=870476 RepID=UPI0024E0DDC1|nr:hypothetical protein [Sphingobium jiangsuense]
MQSPALATAQEFGCPVVIGRNGERMLVRDGVVGGDGFQQEVWEDGSEDEGMSFVLNIEGHGG